MVPIRHKDHAAQAVRAVREMQRRTGGSNLRSEGSVAASDGALSPLRAFVSDNKFTVLGDYLLVGCYPFLGHVLIVDLDLATAL